VLEDDAHRRVMGRLAQRRAAAFDWSLIAQRIERVYMELTGEAPASVELERRTAELDATRTAQEAFA
jgi:hypothetical protein